MPELRPLELSAVVCLSAPAELDRLAVARAVALRVARDEVLLVAGPSESARIVAEAVAALAQSALVVDQTDGFAGWTIAGPDAHEAFARLSAVPLPDALPDALQGLVAHVPAKIFAARDRIDLLVPSTIGHHVRERVLAACADLGPREEPAVPFPVAVHAGQGRA